MKRFLKLILLTAFCILQFAFISDVYSQCQAYIKIDGNMINANQIASYGLTLPGWLKAGQSLAADQMVNSISVIEFSVNNSALEFSQVLAVTSSQTVQSGKVWKIESIYKKPSFGSASTVTYSSPGSNNFVVPACASYICIEVWGAGGGGGGCHTSQNGSGGGGGGGGYGQGCFSVTAGASYTVTVGSGGAGGSCGSSGSTGGTTSVVGLISATGGSGGAPGPTGAGGAGGTSTASVFISGNTGQNGVSGCYATTQTTVGCGIYAGKGGDGGNGGAGGTIQQNCDQNNPIAPVIPGGGGGGGARCNSSYAGYTGAVGQVKISW